MGFEAASLTSEAESKFDIAWLYMSGCIPVARNKRMESLDHKGETPLLLLGRFGEEELDRRIADLSPLVEEGESGARKNPLKLNVECVCDRMKAILAFAHTDCAFERAFDRLSAGELHHTDIHFRELHYVRLSESSALRLYSPFQVWAKRVSDRFPKLMQARMASLPFFKFVVEDMCPSDGVSKTLRYKFDVTSAPELGEWVPIEGPTSREDAKLRGLEEHFRAAETLRQVAIEAMKVPKWHAETPLEFVNLAEGAMKTEAASGNPAYNAFSQAIQSLRHTENTSKEIFISKIEALCSRIWDAPLLAPLWSKAIQALTKDEIQRRRLFADAGLSLVECENLDALAKDEQSIAISEFRSERLMSVVEIRNETATLAISGIDLQPPPQVPLEIFPKILRPHLRPGLLLEAFVLASARNSEDLQIQDIHLPLNQKVPDSGNTGGIAGFE